MADERAVWPFTLFPGAFDLQMPKDAQFLEVTVVDGVPVLFALVDPTAPIETRTFSVHATIESFSANGLRYVGTFVGKEGAGHLFEQFEQLERGEP